MHYEVSLIIKNYTHRKLIMIIKKINYSSSFIYNVVTKLDVSEGLIYAFVVIHKLPFLMQGSFNSTGLIVSSKLPRFSDMYTLNIASADPQSISARPTVEFTRSVTQWLALYLYCHFLCLFNCLWWL